MKLTKRELKKIVMEELSSIKEGGAAGHYISNYPSREPGYGLPSSQPEERAYKEPEFYPGGPAGEKNWAIRRSGVSDEEGYLGGGYKWGPEEDALRYEFEQEARGIIKYGVESGKIDSGQPVELAPVEPLVLPKVTPDSLKRMRQGIKRVERPRAPGDYRSRLDRWKLEEIIQDELKKEWVNRGELEELPEPTGPGWGKKYRVVIPQGNLEVDDLGAAVETAKKWQEMGIEPDPEGTSPEVMEALGSPEQLAEYGVGSLPNLNLNPRRGDGWREGTPEEQAELERLHSSGSGEEDIIGELREMLQVWEMREYPSDRDRYIEYAEDVEALIKRHEMPLEEENKNEVE